MHEKFSQAVFHWKNPALHCGLSAANVGPLTAGTPPTKGHTLTKKEDQNYSEIEQLQAKAKQVTSASWEIVSRPKLCHLPSVKSSRRPQKQDLLTNCCYDTWKKLYI